MSFGPAGPLLGGGGSYISPSGPSGPWAGCGCSSFLIVIAGIIMVMAGCLRMIGH